MAYKLVHNWGGVIRLADNRSIPPNPDNPYWREYQEWLALGNTPDPADPEPPPDSTAVAKVGAKAWYLDNPNAALLFELSIEDLQTEVAALVNALFPTATAGNRTKMILLLMTLSVSVRVLAKREGFVD